MFCAGANITMLGKDGTAVGTLTFEQTDKGVTMKGTFTGLKPGRDYWYRFRAGNLTSPIGRTRTAPAPSATPEALRFGIVTCAEWEFGFFGAYRLLAERDTGLRLAGAAAMALGVALLASA